MRRPAAKSGRFRLSSSVSPRLGFAIPDTQLHIRRVLGLTGSQRPVTYAAYPGVSARDVTSSGGGGWKPISGNRLQRRDRS